MIIYEVAHLSKTVLSRERSVSLEIEYTSDAQILSTRVDQYLSSFCFVVVVVDPSVSILSLSSKTTTSDILTILYSTRPDQLQIFYLSIKYTIYCFRIQIFQKVKYILVVLRDEMTTSSQFTHSISAIRMRIRVQ